MDEVLDFDALYARSVPAYVDALARADHSATDEHALQILAAARGLLFYVASSSPGGPHDPEVIEDAIVDASMEVLAMARDFNSERGVTFAQWLKSRSAPWRPALNAVIEHARNRAELKPAEKRALALARGVIAEFVTQHGHQPTMEQVAELVEQAEAARGEDLAVVRARNIRSGFAAAARDLPLLLRGTLAPMRPDRAGSEGQDLWDVVTDTPIGDPTGDQATAADHSAQLAALAGIALEDVDSDTGKVSSAERARALRRLASPHAQWAHLSAVIGVAR